VSVTVPSPQSNLTTVKRNIVEYLYALSQGSGPPVDPLADVPFAIRLQTHNGNNVPLGLFQDTACTIPATSDFELVAAWRDELSGSGLVLTQSNVNQRPMLFFINGVPTLFFDGSDDRLQGSLTGIGVTSYTISCAGQILSGTENALCDLSPNPFTNNGPMLFEEGGNMKLRTLAGGTPDLSYAYSSSTWKHHMGTKGAAGFFLYEDNTQKATNASTANLDNAPILMRLGMLFQDIYPLNGGIASFFAIPPQVTTDQRNLINTYQQALFVAPLN